MRLLPDNGRALLLVGFAAMIPGCRPAALRTMPGDCGSGIRQSAHVTQSAPWSRELDRYVDSLERVGRSGTILVAKAHEVRYSRGFGYADRARCVPSTDSTLFDIASIAKVFTAIAIAQLEETGRIRFTDSLGKFFAAVPPDKSGITVQNLLTHTAGLQAFHDTAGDFEPMTRDEAVRRILADTLRFAPGAKEAYSNSGYTLLAAIVEKVTGMSFQDYVRRNVIDRAGLKHTWFWEDPAMPRSLVAIGYVGKDARGEPWKYPLTWASQGGAGLLMDARDLNRLAAALDGGLLVSRQTELRMRAPLLRKWSQGWEVSQTPAGLLVMKGGASDSGFTAQLRRYVDQDVVVVVLLNSKQSADDWPHIEVGPRVSSIALAGLAPR